VVNLRLLSLLLRKLDYRVMYVQSSHLKICAAGRMPEILAASSPSPRVHLRGPSCLSSTRNRSLLRCKRVCRPATWLSVNRSSTSSSKQRCRVRAMLGMATWPSVQDTHEMRKQQNCLLTWSIACSCAYVRWFAGPRQPATNAHAWLHATTRAQHWIAKRKSALSSFVRVVTCQWRQLRVKHAFCATQMLEMYDCTIRRPYRALARACCAFLHKTNGTVGIIPFKTTMGAETSGASYSTCSLAVGEMGHA
jgi:hypothetical protein